MLIRNIWPVRGAKSRKLGAMTGVAIDEVVKDAKSGVHAIGYALPGAVNYIVFTIVGLILMSIL